MRKNKRQAVKIYKTTTGKLLCENSAMLNWKANQVNETKSLVLKKKQNFEEDEQPTCPYFSTAFILGALIRCKWVVMSEHCLLSFSSSCFTSLWSSSWLREENANMFNEWNAQEKFPCGTTRVPFLKKKRPEPSCWLCGQVRSCNSYLQCTQHRNMHLPPDVLLRAWSSYPPPGYRYVCHLLFHRLHIGRIYSLHRCTHFCDGSLQIFQALFYALRILQLKINSTMQSTQNKTKLPASCELKILSPRVRCDHLFRIFWSAIQFLFPPPQKKIRIKPQEETAWKCIESI